MQGTLSVNSLVKTRIPTPSGLCAIYTRKSSDPTGQQLGVTRQYDECLALVERLGWGKPTLFSDNDTSASGKVARPGYLALLAAIEAGQVASLVIWHPDRLHRSPRELERFIDLIEAHGVRIDTVSAGAYDLTTPAGRLSARIVGATARYEGEQKAARQRAQKLQAARLGKPAGHGRARTFGYSRDGMTLVEPEAEAIRWAASEIRSGATGTSVLRGLAERGFTTTEGNAWRLSGLSRLLTLPRLAGYRIVDGEVFHGDWPKVLTMEEHAELVGIYEGQSRKATNPGARSLLVGLAVCGHCGRKLTAGATRNRVRGKVVTYKLYWCKDSANQKGCNSLTIRQANADEAVGILAVRAVIEAAEPTTEAKERLEALEDAYYVRGEMTAERFDTLSRALRPKATTMELDALLDGTERSAEALTKAWTAGSTTWRRSLLEQVCQSVTVAPALKRGRVSKALDRLTIH